MGGSSDAATIHRELVAEARQFAVRSGYLKLCPYCRRTAYVNGIQDDGIAYAHITEAVNEGKIDTDLPSARDAIRLLYAKHHSSALSATTHSGTEAC